MPHPTTIGIVTGLAGVVLGAVVGSVPALVLGGLAIVAAAIVLTGTGDARERFDWHRAELTPNYGKRQARRAAFDEKYDRCSHGTHPRSQCDGKD